MRSWRDEKPVKGDFRKELARGNRFAQVLAEAERDRRKLDLEHAWKGIRVFPAPKSKTIPQAPAEAPQTTERSPR